MATISQYRGKWKAQIRMKGYPAQTKTFDTKSEAQAWGREVESQMARQQFSGSTSGQTMTVREMLQRYLDEVSVTKARPKDDVSRAKPVFAALGDYRVHTLTSLNLSQYKAARLLSVGPQTVIHELNLLHRAYVIAASERGVVLPNGIPKTRRPPMPKGRDMRVPPEVVDRIVASTESPELKVIIRFAVETAMRRSEIMGIRWEHVNLARRSVYLPKTKTDQPRTVPLSTVALGLLEEMGPEKEGKVFSLAPDSVTQGFKRAAVRARMGDINFHDLRHEATSRLFEKGLNVIEVARITGHKTLAMLDRYTHLDVANLVQKLN
ncbi:site-specific integrase [Herbaspirillum sp.]|uniref:site-specific integrase n=1 Tax=Herbaspirillum sp. TaxID=1890675 RepID=UPI001B039A6B|nr:site-specific integrase [Herbaspirillum sp.]MBO9535208.1 tyrosine-type recombinase/integrase [Herbaspirillum sp.]